MVFRVLHILGSIGLFLFGMKLMSEGIQRTAGERLQRILNFMTGNRFSSVFTGFSITALIQSSSATTVMVVSFVNAGLLTLVQAAGVIMGANIGTTVTGWLVALLGFKVDIFALAMFAVAVGIPFLFIKRFARKPWAETLIGFGILFIGLSLLKDSVPDIRENPEVLRFLSQYTDQGFRSFLLFVLVGTLLTVIVQSSSAAMAVTIAMAYAGWIDFPTAAAVVLGENIGTTITAFLASLSANTNARRAARIHTVFNILGVVWMAFLFSPFLRMVDMVVPGSVNTASGLPSHLAMFHTLFNIANTLLFIGFVPQLASISKRLVFKREEISERYRFPYISGGIQRTPELNVLEAKKEIEKMAGIVEDMFKIFVEVFFSPDKKMKNEVEHIKMMEDYTDDMQEEISQYLVQCSEDQVNDVTFGNINAMMRIVSELESIGDSCYNLILLSQRRYDKKIKFDKDAITDIKPYTALVEEFLKYNRERLGRHLSAEEFKKAVELENSIDDCRDTYKKASRKRLKGGSSVKSELLYLDFLKHIEHIGDHSLNISQALRQIR
ncbi:MAG: Na/Pi cotransporter family protein [Spirochaetia bacterium]